MYFMNFLKKTSSKIFITGFVTGLLMVVLPVGFALLTEGRIISLPRTLTFFPTALIAVLLAEGNPFDALTFHGIFMAFVFLVAYRFYRWWKWSLVVIVLLYILLAYFFHQWISFNMFDDSNMIPPSSELNFK